MKEKILKILILITGFVSLILFISVRMNRPPSFIIDEVIYNDKLNLNKGDLYYLCRVENFSETLPRIREYDSNLENADISEAELLIFGDSFFRISRATQTMPELLGDSLNKKICFISSSRPLLSLTEKNRGDKKKILLFEVVERNISSAFLREHTLSDRNKYKRTAFLENLIPVSREENYTELFKNGKFTGDIYKYTMTFKFNTFGIISDLTPVSIKDPPWLFYYSDITGDAGFYRSYTPNEIEGIAEKISKLSILLDKEFNIDLVMLFIPNKYTLYHKLINNDKYNDFIPRLNSELGKKGVETVNVYDAFKSSDEILYYPTDTHWNEKGMKIALGLILEKIRSLETTR